MLSGTSRVLPLHFLSDKLAFFGNKGLDARGVFCKVIIVKTLGPYRDTLRLKWSVLANPDIISGEIRDFMLIHSSK